MHGIGWTIGPLQMIKPQGSPIKCMVGLYTPISVEATVYVRKFSIGKVLQAKDYVKFNLICGTRQKILRQ